mmetsp:Transcript_11632/g.30463  ORF Transcript_11632/g.30463 Transcript_11632/m.30463 type:complete len:429 (+) Transcript_11632:162-1448(+)
MSMQSASAQSARGRVRGRTHSPSPPLPQLDPSQMLRNPERGRAGSSNSSSREVCIELVEALFEPLLDRAVGGGLARGVREEHHLGEVEVAGAVQVRGGEHGLELGGRVGLQRLALDNLPCRRDLAHHQEELGEADLPVKVGVPLAEDFLKPQHVGALDHLAIEWKCVSLLHHHQLLRANLRIPRPQAVAYGRHAWELVIFIIIGIFLRQKFDRSVHLLGRGSARRDCHLPVVQQTSFRLCACACDKGRELVLHHRVIRVVRCERRRKDAQLRDHFCGGRCGGSSVGAQLLRVGRERLLPLYGGDRVAVAAVEHVRGKLAQPVLRLLHRVLVQDDGSALAHPSPRLAPHRHSLHAPLFHCDGCDRLLLPARQVSSALAAHPLLHRDGCAALLEQPEAHRPAQQVGAQPLHCAVLRVPRRHLGLEDRQHL